jgi:hypothetical protein
MKAIFKGETVVKSTLTLNTGLEKLDGSDVSYFTKEPELVHTAVEKEDEIILEKDLSFNRILTVGLLADEITMDGMTFTVSSVEVDFDKDCVVFYVPGVCTVEDADKEEKINTYHKLMDAYSKQVEAREEKEDDCCGCGFCSKEGDFSGEEYDETKGFNEEGTEKKVMDDLDDLNEILTAFFGDVPGFKC